MCGIIGYVGTEQNSDKIVLEGLKKLEYRGYDSWGIVVNDGTLHSTKKVGEIEDINETGLPKAGIGMGHTRWATHGAVNVKNSHPQFSMSGNLALVHNGIVENYQELKDFLLKNNYKFQSETDTEIIPNLIDYYLSKGSTLFDSFKNTLDRIKGNYAVLLMSKDSEKILAARKGSPLVLGINSTGNFVASDIPAFLERTRKVVYLFDRDVVELNKDSYRIFNLDENNYVNRKIDDINWSVEQAEKGEFKHFMMKEISEQTMTVEAAARQDKKHFSDATKILKDAKKIIFIGCGSSYHTCLSAKYNFAHIANVDVTACLASELIHFNQFIDKNTALVAVSQSGETADVLEAVKSAKTRGAKIIAVSNVMGSSLMRESNCTLLLNAGPEIGVLSTKTYTSQLVILNMLAFALAGKFEEGRKVLKELVRHIYYLTSVNARDHLKRLSEQLRYSNHLFLIGRGMQYPTALEAALKIKEVSYIHAEGFAGAELKHGTIALIEHGTPCIVFTEKGRNNEKILSNAAELKSRGAFIIGVSEENNDIFDFFVKVRDAGELNSICQIIPIQILSYQLALLRGCNPDKPRNLAKSVTVK